MLYWPVVVWVVGVNIAVCCLSSILSDVKDCSGCSIERRSVGSDGWKYQ